MPKTVSVSEASGGYRATVKITRVEDDESVATGSGTAVAMEVQNAINKAERLAEAALLASQG